MDTIAFGDFKVIREVGSGSLGKLFHTEHRFIRKPFAVKLLPRELTDLPGFVDRFEAEVGKLSELSHPSIVKIHTISSHQGQYFLAYDWIGTMESRAMHLGEYLSQKKTRLAEAEIVEILTALASALDYLHSITFQEKPLVHRGIKLSNILLTHHDQILQLHLTDTALSMVVGEGELLRRNYLSACEQMQKHQHSKDTAGLNFIQNFAFLAPEQKLFSTLDSVDEKADVYAFGVLAYFLLMGKAPEGVFPLPSQGEHGLVHNWDLLIESCLQSQPEKRPIHLMTLLRQVMESRIELSEAGASLEGLYKKQRAPSLKAPERKDPTDPPYVPTKQKEEGSLEKFSAAPFTPRDGGSQGLKLEKETATVMTKPSVTTEAKRRLEASKVSQYSEFEERLSSVGGKTMNQPDIRPSEIKRCEFDEDPGKIFQKETVVARYRPEKKEIKDVEPLLTDMIVVDGGDYRRGSNQGSRDEKPEHSVHLSSYALDMHPVTNEQFVRFLEVLGSEKDSNNSDVIHLKDSRIKRNAGKLTIETGYTKHPVVGVTWYGAIAYAKWVGKRLPTEAEWEIAAASGHMRAFYPSGNEIERSQANFFGSDTTPVMSYPANPLGFFDMAGNVYEWCSDWYDYNFYGASEQEPDNPEGPQQGVYRVLRGGCWKSLKDDMRCSHRHRNNPGAINRTYGFRCAADVKSS